MTIKLMYFLDVGPVTDKKTQDAISNIEGFKDIYFALSGGVLPSDGYLARFEVERLKDANNVKNTLSGIKGIRRFVLLHGP